MGAEWQILSLKEAGITLIDCDHRTPPAASNGYPYVTIPQMHEGRLDIFDARRISREHFVEWTKKAKPQSNDVVLSRRCNPGETAFVSDGLEFALGQNLVLLRSDGSQIYPPFLRWLVRGPAWWDQIGKFLNVGAVFDSLKCADIPNFELPMPPLSEQRAIADILGALDDKIELNRRMNETLEAMARALFKSWFVEFDPVRARAEERETGLPPDFTDLFPDSFAESELGEIPTGWEAKSIREVASRIQYGFTQSASTEKVGPRFLRITDIQGGKVNWSSVPYCLISEDEHERYRLLAGDVLVARTGASTGENVYLVDPPDAVFASYLVRFQFLDSETGRLVGAFMRTAAYFDYVAGCIGGSAQPNASAQTLAGALLVVPSTAAARKFADLVAPWDAKIAANNRASSTLASLRNVLLPKLISGELRVKDAEKHVDTAA